MMRRKAVEEGWLIQGLMDRLKFESRLEVTGGDDAIVIGGDDGISSPPSRSLFKCCPRFLGEQQRGELVVWGRAPLLRVVGFVGAFSTLARQ